MDLTKVYNSIDSWARDIEAEFFHHLKLGKGKEVTLNGCIATKQFDISLSDSIRASDVTKYIHSRGMEYSNNARYFFVLEKKKFLFLLIYPYQATSKVHDLPNN